MEPLHNTFTPGNSTPSWTAIQAFSYTVLLFCNIILKYNFLLNHCRLKFCQVKIEISSIVSGCDILCHTFLDGGRTPHLWQSHFTLPIFCLLCLLHVNFTWTTVWRNQIIRILNKRFLAMTSSSRLLSLHTTLFVYFMQHHIATCCHFDCHENTLKTTG